jgi:hypothetical protein
VNMQRPQRGADDEEHDKIAPSHLAYPLARASYRLNRSSSISLAISSPATSITARRLFT